MLSSPRWTTLDMYLVIALCIFAMRVLLDDTAYAGHDQTPQDRLESAAELLDPPLPSARLIRQNSLDHVYIAIRCLGLAEMQRENACSGSNAADCRKADANVRRMERVLWPKGRPGQFALAYRGKSNTYAQAYRTAADGAYGAQRSSSELIIRRDSAMCRESQAYYEARLHEYKDRQPG